MIFAPVIIPTLNRFDHFKECIDSLNANHNADQTEVYVSVDFPPSDKYQEGHDKICDYLENGTFHFKELHVIKQTENLGVCGRGKKYGNEQFLTMLVREKYDRWIVSEDDNVFSPGFLDFMNMALDVFEKDETVFSVCGYRFYYSIKAKDNNFFRQHSDFNGWGCGFWKRKYDEAQSLEVDYLRRMVYNPIKVLRLWRVSNLKVSHLANFSRRKNFKRADNYDTIYMIDHGMTQIMPIISLVRNIGWDKSGINCIGFDDDVVNKHLTQVIDVAPIFEGLKGTGWECFKENEKVIRKEDFQRCSFFYALKEYIKRIICFWK